MVTVVAVGGLMLVYEASTFDLLPWGPLGGHIDPSAPVPGARLDFTATAYCKGTTTASGAEVRTGIAAADADLLPVGSVVSVTTDNAKYNGVYTIMDTGPSVQGRRLDLYMWSCHEALSFGRKPVQVTILRLGWNPGASMPSLIDRLFHRRESVAIAPVPPSAPTVNPDATQESAGEGAPAIADESAPIPTPGAIVPSPGTAPLP